MIEENIEYCQSEIKKIINNENKDNHYIRKMNYFIAINQEQKDSIIKFLIHDSKRRALSKARWDYKYIRSILDFPYTFSIIPDNYNPRIPHNVEAKFGHLAILEYREILKKYEEDKDEYYKYIDDYIKKEDVCSNILDKVIANYFLKERTSLIQVSIDNFKTNNLLVFINLIAIQIEGIFFDYCKTIGIDDIETKHYTLTEKIDIINSKEQFYGFEYYNFEYPKLRNKVAHGRFLESKDVLNIANELVLDLNYLVSLFHDNRLPINMLIEIFRAYKKEKPNTGDLADYLVMGAENETLFKYLFETTYDEVLEFYGIKNNRDEILEYLKNDDVWNTLITNLENQNKGYYYEEFNKKIEIIKNVFMKRPDYRNQSIRLNKKLCEIKTEHGIA